MQDLKNRGDRRKTDRWLPHEGQSLSRNHSLKNGRECVTRGTEEGKQMGVTGSGARVVLAGARALVELREKVKGSSPGTVAISARGTRGKAKGGGEKERGS